jgi:Trk-type K+ transport system membrane component
MTYRAFRRERAHSSIIFELVSGYGTVGISLGTPYSATSFCAAWSPVSKRERRLAQMRSQ